MAQALRLADLTAYRVVEITDGYATNCGPDTIFWLSESGMEERGCPFVFIYRRMPLEDTARELYDGGRRFLGSTLMPCQVEFIYIDGWQHGPYTGILSFAINTSKGTHDLTSGKAHIDLCISNISVL